MSIPDTFEFDKDGEVVKFPLLRRLFLVFFVVFIGLLAFGLGRLSAGQGRAGVTIEYDPALLLASSTAPSQSPVIDLGKAQTSAVGNAVSGGVFASSKGKRYYYTGCKSTISEANKITFATAVEAEKAGYTLAANCKAK